MAVKDDRRQALQNGRVRDGMVERGDVAQSPDGRLWRVLKVDDGKVVLAKLRGRKRIEHCGGRVDVSQNKNPAW